MSYSKPLTEETYAGPKVCAICGNRCNGTPEVAHQVLGEGPERAWFSGHLTQNVRQQPGRPGNTNAEPDIDPILAPGLYGLYGGGY